MSLVKKTFSKNRLGWTKTFKTGLCQDNEGEYLPWMPYSLIEYLDKNLKKDESIFEYGFGTSSFYFAKKVTKVISVESNPKWHEIMLELSKESKIDNIDTILMTDALTNEKYENLVAEFTDQDPDFHGFDWIIVDSLKRSKCIKNSIRALKDGGKIILDDSQRSSYQKIREFMIEEGFECLEFEDIAPGQLKSKKAWVFQR